jgi:hypothetical protein
MLTNTVYPVKECNDDLASLSNIREMLRNYYEDLLGDAVEYGDPLGRSEVDEDYSPLHRLTNGQLYLESDSDDDTDDDMPPLLPVTSIRVHPYAGRQIIQSRTQNQLLSGTRSDVRGRSYFPTQYSFAMNHSLERPEDDDVHSILDDDSPLESSPYDPCMSYNDMLTSESSDDEQSQTSTNSDWYSF